MDTCAHRSCHAVLVRDPRNQYDGNASGRQIEDRPVGYLSRGDAARYAPVFDQAKCPAVAVDAVIPGGMGPEWIGPGSLRRVA